MNTMRKLAWVALVIVVICSVFLMLHTDAQEPEFDHWVFAPLVQKSHAEPTPTPTITPTPWRPPPTPVPTPTPLRPPPTPRS